MGTSQPNILVIMSDEHDPAVCSVYGDPLVRTPSFERLAASGVTFDAAYCNSPLCVPSRLSFTAGQHVHRIGAWNNDCWIDREPAPTLPRVLREAGYDAYLCGKQHYDQDRRYGFTEIPSGPVDTNGSTKHGHCQRLSADGSSPPGHDSWRSRSAEFGPAEESWIWRHDIDVTDATCRFLEERGGDDETPFFFFAGHISPHFRLLVPPEYHERYRGKVPMPEIPEGFLENLPRQYRDLRHSFGLELADRDPDTVRLGRECYWALVDWYDGQVGRILDTLEKTGRAQDTVVVYTSDHGENKGDHGLWWKNAAYESASRVPLLVSWPARWAGGQRRSTCCSLVDLVQTLCEIGGAEVPPHWDGDSLVPQLDDAGAPARDQAVSMYYGHNISSGWAMIRRGPWKYVYHSRADAEHGPERELYDLDADPKEFANLADDPDQADRITALHKALVEELGEEPDAIEERFRRERAEPYRR